MSFLNLKAILGLNASGYFIGMKQAGYAADQLAAKLKNTFANYFGIGALTAYAKSVIDFADHLGDLSDQLEISTQTLQAWGNAALRNGSNLDAVAKMFEKLSEAREKAMGGDASSEEAFRRIGIDPARLSTMNLQQLGAALSAAVKNTKDIQALYPVLRELAGKGFRDLIPTLQEGFDVMKQTLEETGGGIDEEVISKIKEAKTEVELLAQAFRGPVATAIAILSRSLSYIVISIQKVLTAAGTFAIFRKEGFSVEDAEKAAQEESAEIDKQNADAEQRIRSASERRSSYDTQPGSALKALVQKTLPDLPLTANQKAGAFVRFDPVNNSIKAIEVNTAKIAENTSPERKAIKYPYAASAYLPQDYFE